MTTISFITNSFRNNSVEIIKKRSLEIINLGPMVKDRAQAPKNFLRENEISLLSKSLFMLNCPIGKNCAKGTAKSSSNLKLGTIQLVINAANYSFKRC